MIGEIRGQRIDIQYNHKIWANRNFLLPTITLNLNVTSKPASIQNLANITLLNPRLLLSIDGQSRQVITRVEADSLRYYVGANSAIEIQFHITLDHHKLAQIERLRANRDLVLSAKVKSIFHQTDDMSTMEERETDDIEIRVPKSEWVETILPNTNYKDVVLVEVPVLEFPALKRAIDKLNDAWKKYSMGDYDGVLVDCRKALEDLSKYIQKQGFKIKVKGDDDGIERPYPDWKKFLASESKGDVLMNINKKMGRFNSPSAHAGGVLDAPNAYFALLQTMSIAHLVISTCKKRKDSG